MTATFKQTGDAMDYVPAADTPAGTVVVMGELVGVAKLDIKLGALGALALSGVFEFPKATGDNTGLDMGEPVYWDDAAKVVTAETAGGVNKYLGKTVRPALNDTATVRVRLSQ